MNPMGAVAVAEDADASTAGGGGSSSGAKKQMSIGGAAFMILRVRRVFRRKVNASKSNGKPDIGASGGPVTASSACGNEPATASGGRTLHRGPVPLLRSRTLPAIVVPGLTILQAHIESSLASGSSNSSTITAQSPPSSSSSTGDNKSSSSRTQQKGSYRSSELLVDSGSIATWNTTMATFTTATDNSSKRPSPTSGIACKTNRLPKFLKSGTSTTAATFTIATSFRSPLQPMPAVPIIVADDESNASANYQSQRQRRHSLESNKDAGNGQQQQRQDVTTLLPSSSSSSAATRLLNLNVPDLPGKSVPPSPSGSFRRVNKSSTNDRKKESTSLELLVQHGLGHLTRTDLKKMEKVSRINIHLHALFAAVEFGQVEKARAILDNNEVDINSYNSDGLSLLDVALLTSNVDMVKLLAKHGATEGLQFGRSSKEALSLHLVQLLNEAEKQLDDTSSPATSATTSSNSPLRIDQDKHLALWKRRVRILRKMKSGLEQLKLPNSPNQARVEVVGERSAHVWWLQPEIDTTTASAGIATKFKVQWSTQPDFNPLGQGGEVEVRDAAGRRLGSSGSNGDELNEVRVTVSDCPVNAKCYFRVAAGNLSGFGQFKATLPSSVQLSAWRAIDGRKPRFAGRLPALDDLFGKVRTWRPDYASEIRQVDDDVGGGGSGGGSTSADWQNKQRKNAAKINLRQFFGATVKFQKNLRRGVYFACTLFHEDKVLVTSEEFPPVVEVDDTYPASVNNDFHWLMKIGCTWSDVKALRQDMERSLSSSSAHFRIKLLQAAAQLQTALGLQDLGQLHYQPLKDSQGTMVISSTCHLANIKAIPPSLNFKWLPLSKLQQRRRQQQESETSSSSSSSPSASDLLIASLDEQISFQQVSSKPLRRGLYLGYLKMKSSVDLIRVLVPKDAPNLLPHWKIRDNPWVSSEEWQWIKKLAKSQVPPTAGEADDGGRTDENKPPQPTTGQLLFQSQLQRAAHKLLASMGISDTALQHRIYEDEVIELSPEISVILLLPPADSVCAVAGQSDALFHRPEFLSVPVQVFEMIHLRTYQRELIGRYSRLSSILELDSNLAQLALREAFSSVELAEAKQRIVRLQELQVQVDSTWRGSRWIMDVLSLARDRSVGTGVGVAISALSSHHSPPPPIPMLPTPTETVPPTAVLQEVFSSNTSSSRRLQANEGITRQGSGGRQRLLVKTKSDNKLLVSNNNNNNNNRMMTAAESPAALLRVLAGNNDSPTARSRTPVCTECSVPLDLPGYVTNCSECSFSRNPRTQALSHQRMAGAGELLFARQQHSRSNEALQQPMTLSHPPLSLQHSSSTGEVHQHQHQRRVISRSENQLNSLGFLPFLDAEDCESATTPAYATVAGEEAEHQQQQEQQQQQQEETLAPPSKLQRGGSSGAVKKVTSSSSAASSSGRRPSSLIGGRSDSRGEDSEPTSLLPLRSGEASHQSTPSLTSLSSTEGESAGSSTRSSVAAATSDGAAAVMEPEATGIIQVYAAYESGLANGTSVKLHVTTRTVAREVVDLVVRQLNMAVVLKGKEGPVYSADEFKNFCLVAVIGARERCLRDDFRPLHLQNPWKKGRLFVRQKKDVLAAIEQSGRQHQHHQHSSQPAAL